MEEEKEDEWSMVGLLGEDAVCAALAVRLGEATGAAGAGLDAALAACCAVPSTTCGHQFVPGDRMFSCQTCMRTCNAVFCEACFVPAQHTGHDWSVSTTLAPGGTCDCGDPQQLHPTAFCPRHAAATTPPTTPRVPAAPAPAVAAAHTAFVSLLTVAADLADTAAAANRAVCAQGSCGSAAREVAAEPMLRALVGGAAAFCDAHRAGALLGEALVARGAAGEALVARLLRALDMLRHATRRRLHALLCACFACAAFKLPLARVFLRTAPHTGPLFEFELRAARLRNRRQRHRQCPDQGHDQGQGLEGSEDDNNDECAWLLETTNLDDQLNACFDALAPHVLWTPDVAAALAADDTLNPAETLIRMAHARLQPVLTVAASHETATATATATANEEEEENEKQEAAEDMLVDVRASRVVFYMLCFLHSERAAFLACFWRDGGAAVAALLALCAAAEGCDAHVRKACGNAEDFAVARAQAIALPLTLLEPVATQLAGTVPPARAEALVADTVRALRAWAAAHPAQVAGTAVSPYHPLAHTLVAALCALARRGAGVLRAAAADTGVAGLCAPVLVAVPARLLRFAAELDAGRWVRNGTDFGWYANVYRLGADGFVGADVAALQLACALSSPDDVAAHIFHTHGIHIGDCGGGGDGGGGGGDGGDDDGDGEKEKGEGKNEQQQQGQGKEQEEEQSEEEGQQEEERDEEELGWALQTVVVVACDREVARETAAERLRHAAVQLLAARAESFSALAAALRIEPFEAAALAALEAALAETAVFAPPTRTLASGTYALRPALWREYDGAWPRRRAPDREAAEERYYAARQCTAPRAPPRAMVPALAPATRILAVPAVVHAVSRVLTAAFTAAAGASGSPSPPPVMLLARALDVVERALMLGCGAPYAGLVPRIATLGGTKSIEATAARIARLGAATALPQQPGLQQPPRADFRSRAQDQQARIMAMLRAQQSKVLHHMTDDSAASSQQQQQPQQQPQQQSQEVQVDEKADEKEEKEEKEKETDEEEEGTEGGDESDGLCMLCHEPVCFSDCASECLARPAGYATHIVASRVMAVVRRQCEEQCGPLSFALTPDIPETQRKKKHNEMKKHVGDDDENDDDEERYEEEEEEDEEEDDEEEEEENEGEDGGWRDGVVQTCGHVMHCDCYAAYLERLGHAPAACPAYRCPLCSRHCNTLFPVVARRLCHLPTAAARALTWVAHAVAAQLGTGAAPAATPHGWYTRTTLARLCPRLHAVLCTTLAEGEHVLRAPGAALHRATPRFWRACFDALWYLHQYTAPQRSSSSSSSSTIPGTDASSGDAAGVPELARDPFFVCVGTVLAARDPGAPVFAAAAQHALAAAQTQAHLVHAVRTGADVAATPFFAAAGPAAVAAATDIVRMCHRAASAAASTTTAGASLDPAQCTTGLLRKLLVAQRALYGGSLAPAHVPHDPAALLRALRLELPPACACVSALTETAAFVVSASASAASSGVPRPVPRVACEPPGLPRLRLVDLPREYVELAARFPAHYRGWRDVAPGAAVCLVCGALFPGGPRARRALARHPARCAGTCPLLYLQHAAVIVVTPGGHGGPWAALCYLGPHGEDDIGLRKGLRLTLDRARYDDLLRALVAHALDGRYPAVSFHVPRI